MINAYIHTTLVFFLLSRYVSMHIPLYSFNKLIPGFMKEILRPLNILLAEDDNDDRFFFGIALNSIHFSSRLQTVENGEQLMAFLTKKNVLPDVILLDLNMPRKNGAECLAELMKNEKLKNIPVIIYSTSLNNDIADLLYSNGAYYYICKTTNLQLINVLQEILPRIQNKIKRPQRNEFILGLTKALWSAIAFNKMKPHR